MLVTLPAAPSSPELLVAAANRIQQLLAGAGSFACSSRSSRALLATSELLAAFPAVLGCCCQPCQLLGLSGSRTSSSQQLLGTSSERLQAWGSPPRWSLQCLQGGAFLGCVDMPFRGGPRHMHPELVFRCKVARRCGNAYISHHLASAPLWGRKSHINRGHMQPPRHRALATQVCGRFDNTPVLGSASRAAVHRPCASCKQPWQVRQEGNHANRAHVLGFVADSATPSVSVSL